MRIAVIGATGMIGHHCALAIAESDHQLTVVHRASSKLDRMADITGDRVVGDLDDKASLATALRGVSAVINCAAYYPTVPRPYRQEVATAHHQMENFYQACADAGVERIVYLGGAIALRRNPSGEPGNETLTYAQAPPGTNAYTQVKWHMDRMALDKAAEGMHVVVGIPSMTFGEHDYGPTTGQFVTEIANQTLPAYVRGNRNTIYAGDAGRGPLRCCEAGQSGERYLLTGENVSMDELVKKIAELASVDAPKAVPLAAAKFLSMLQTLRYKLGGNAPKISSTAIAVMSAGQFLDGSKAERELGFKAAVSLDEALRRALEWFRGVGYVKAQSRVVSEP
ncbi:MAG: NAD-dependent epimerase/dehydratase family protein [Deltaproteobacteria bacterium]|nr:NAD-dependent epimerase/dehydratase family protein [Deltaproteobacteria bacterium]